MPGPVFLRGERLSLRTVESEDHDFVRRHWNRPDIRHGTNRYTPITRGQLTDRFASEDYDEIHFLPCDDGDPVGFLWLFRIDDVAGRGELGYWVCADERGKGYATEAAELGVRYAFDERGLQKVIARVFEGNDASMCVLEKAGFQREGCLRDHYFVDGEHVNTYLYGLLAADR